MIKPHRILCSKHSARHVILTGVSLLGMVVGGQAAFAQAPQSGAVPQAGTGADTAPAGLEDIVVTAQRRSERLQDVPIAVAAVTSTQLAASGVANITDLRVSVTGLNVENHGGYAKPRIRGIGASAVGPGIENAVATYIDGVYIGSGQQSLMSFNNISQIEVLKGPQGTLFGRNATGGLLQVITREPGDVASGNFSIGYANYETLTANGYYATPLTQNLAADLAVSYTNQGEGWGKSSVSGIDIYRTKYDLALRSKIVWQPGDATKVTIIGDYGRKSTTNFPFTLFPGTIAPSDVAAGPQQVRGWNTNSDFNPISKGKGGGVSAKIEQDLGNVKLASITAYRASSFDTGLDLDGTAKPVQFAANTDEERQFSQELQITSSGNGPLKWVAGLYYFDARGRLRPSLIGLPAAGVQVFGEDHSQFTKAISGYAQGTYEVLPDTNITLGLRYNTEKRRLTGDSTLQLFNTNIAIAPTTVVDVSKRFNKMTFRGAIDHKIAPDVMIYASVNRGFKSGGFNASVITDPAFQPEVLDAYEVGLKSEFLDRRLRLNVSGFYYDYKDIQVQIVRTGAPGISNADAARIYGIDVDVEARLSDNLTIKAGGEWLDPKFTRYPDAPTGVPGGGTALVLASAAGNQLPNAAKFVANGSIDYSVPLSNGSIDLNATGYYSSGWYPDPDNIIHQPRFAQVNTSATWISNSGFSFSIWGKNLTNIRTQGFAGTTPQGAQLVTWAAPRTYGVTAGYKF